MNDDLQEYANSLRVHAARMDRTAHIIQHKQKESARRQTVMTQSFHQEVAALNQELSALDTDLHVLARDVKRFIKAFQGLGMQAQLAQLQERVEMMNVEQWINRKEFERLLG